MSNDFRLLERLRDRQGALIVLVAISLVVLLGFAAIAVDIGYVMVAKNELQNISDAASLAATRFIGHTYEPMTYQEQQSYTFFRSTIVSVAQQVALQNQAAGMNITVNDSDVEIGKWNTDTKTFYDVGNLNQPNAVRVTARRDALANGPITTFFARVLGKDTLDVSAKATAALTGESTAGPGGLPVPIGISKAWFDNQAAFNFCNQPIRFYPTNDPLSCAGWHVFDRYDNAPDSRLRQTISDLENGTYGSPDTVAGKTQFEFTGGTMSIQTFAAMKSLFDSRKGLNDGVIDNDTNPLTWTAKVPVYDSPDCSNPGGAMLIVGFATIVITNVQDAPVHQIDGYVICNSFEPGRGSGGNYGTLGSIPGLVEPNFNDL